MASKNYEEMDPDNQDRSSDYYLGVGDATRYFMDLLSEIGRRDDLQARLEEVQELGMELYVSCEDRRRMFFWQHMNAGHLKREELKHPGGMLAEAEIMTEPKAPLKAEAID